MVFPVKAPSWGSPACRTLSLPAQVNPRPTGHSRGGRCHTRGHTVSPHLTLLLTGWRGNPSGLSRSVLSRFPKPRSSTEGGKVWSEFAVGSPLPSLARLWQPQNSRAGHEGTAVCPCPRSPLCRHSRVPVPIRDHPGSRSASGPLSWLQGLHVHPRFPLGCGITEEKEEKITRSPYGPSPLRSSLLPSLSFPGFPFPSGFGEGAACTGRAVRARGKDVRNELLLCPQGTLQKVIPTPHQPLPAGQE